jgi:type I restriction enzyme S subunit
MLQGLEPVMLSMTDESAHGTKALRTDQWSNLPVPVPTPEVQTAIANFLDEQTARIDTLIAEKEQLVERLDEYRMSVATTTVTQGLPGVHKRFVSDRFLGALPTAWRAGRFRHYVQFRSGQVDPEEGEFSGMVLIAPNHIEARTGRLLQTETASEQAAESGKYWCDAGDVIYSKIRPGLRKATMAPFDCLCSADMYPLKGVGPLTNRYLFWYLLSEPFSDFAVQESMRVAMPKLNRETLADAVVPLPPPDEQARIVAYVEEAVGSIDSVIEHARVHIARLREYRSSLISATVTGQLDISTYDRKTA